MNCVASGLAGSRCAESEADPPEGWRDYVAASRYVGSAVGLVPEAVPVVMMLAHMDSGCVESSVVPEAHKDWGYVGSSTVPVATLTHKDWRYVESMAVPVATVAARLDLRYVEPSLVLVAVA